ncbi:MAG: hypothetical protein AAGD10_15270 [Myxococcota bacterium]
MCKFDVSFSATADEVVSKAKSMIEESGGRFEGNVGQGRYTVKLPMGSVEGAYSVTGGILSFHITKKPMIMPCAVIETFLRSRLS